MTGPSGKFIEEKPKTEFRLTSNEFLLQSGNVHPVELQQSSLESVPWKARARGLEAEARLTGGLRSHQMCMSLWRVGGVHVAEAPGDQDRGLRAAVPLVGRRASCLAGCGAGRWQDARLSSSTEPSCKPASSSGVQLEEH